MISISSIVPNVGIPRKSFKVKLEREKLIFTSTLCKNTLTLVLKRANVGASKFSHLNLKASSCVKALKAPPMSSEALLNTC